MGRLAFVVLPLVCILFLASGCKSAGWEDKYLEKEQENRALQEAFDTQNTKLAEKDASADVLQREMGETQAQVDLLAATLEDMENRPVAPVVVLDPSGDEAYVALLAEYERLKLQYGDLVRITEDGNLEITLQSSVTFASGSYNLTRQGKKNLDSVARELITEFPTNNIRVIGHTDTDPIRKSPFKDNWELASERSLEVIRYLTEKGVEHTRLEGSSRGENAPVADNATAAGKKRNRRVEIVVIMPKSGGRIEQR